VGVRCGGEGVVGRASPGTVSPPPTAKTRPPRGPGGPRAPPANTQTAPRDPPAPPRQRAEIPPRHSGRPVEQVMADIDRDRFMTPGEAIEYGLIDAVMETRGAPAKKAA